MKNTTNWLNILHEKYIDIKPIFVHITASLLFKKRELGQLDTIK